MRPFSELNQININDHTKSKNGLTYLPWAHALEELLKQDMSATWEFIEPKIYGKSMMVFTSVTAFGKTLKMQLPVMDNRMNALEYPDARDISDTHMRCLVKNIACFGIGLYLYRGEGVPSDDNEHEDPPKVNLPKSNTTDKSPPPSSTSKAKAPAADKPKVTIKTKPGAEDSLELKALFAVGARFGWTGDQIKKYSMEQYGVKSRTELTKPQINEIIQVIQSGPYRPEPPKDDTPPPSDDFDPNFDTSGTFSDGIR